MERSSLQIEVIGVSSTLRSKLATPKSISSSLIASRAACIDAQDKG